MKSLNRLGMLPASLIMAADDIVEFHAARLLLLLRFCGISGSINGLTKMAKLDFFVRYPDFFEVARAASLSDSSTPAVPLQQVKEVVESAMVRHHYGPWDKRYYHVLAILESKQLVTVIKEGNSYRIALTGMGQQKAKAIAARPSFDPLVARMKEVKEVFGRKDGTHLKKLIYRLFEVEVAQRPMGQII
jgi:hypothetical protein